MGLMMVPLELPSIAIHLGITIPFVLMILLAYIMSWRQGHSGVVFVPLRKGPFGDDGLLNRTAPMETQIIRHCMAFILGVLLGIFATGLIA